MPASTDRPDCGVFDSYNVSRETMGRLTIYREILLKWQKKTNLIAPSTIDEFWDRHVADSLQCYQIKPDAETWIDLGSGGGFPGMVIASVLTDDEKFSMKLVESNAKKCAFLREVARQSGIGTKIRNQRIESFINGDNAPDIVTARALASTGTLLEYCYPWISGDTIGLFHKGRDYRRELEECHDKWRFNLIEHSSKVSTDSVILEISALERR